MVRHSPRPSTKHIRNLIIFTRYYRCLDVTSTKELITQYSDPHETSTEHSNHCDDLLLWHFNPVTFTAATPPPIWYIQVTNVHTVKDGHFFTLSGRPSFFYLDFDRMSTFALNWNVDIFSHVTGVHLEVFWLVWQGGRLNVTMVKNRAQRWDTIGHTDTWISWACALTWPKPW
jgi:hypothetical protein